MSVVNEHVQNRRTEYRAPSPFILGSKVLDGAIGWAANDSLFLYEGRAA